MVERIEYDEFGLFHENAAEYGLGYDGPPTVRREFVEVEPGRQLSALVWGTEAPELVLLHGGSQNAHTWDTVAMALGRPLVAIDLPGHGHSDGPREQPPGEDRMTPRSYAEDVSIVIRALAPDAQAVVGMSYGGLTTIALTELAPELVRKVVLVDVTPGVTRAHSRQITDFINGPPTFPNFDELLDRTVKYNPTRSVSSLRRGILHNAVQLEDGTWVWRWARWRKTGEGGPLANTERQDTERQDTDRQDTDRQGTDRQGTDQPDQAADDTPMLGELWDVVSRVQVPLLLARGMLPQSVIRDEEEVELLQRLPHAQVVHFEKAGHSIQGDMPVELAREIEAFVFS
jgi:pimeloyl-ACP methyl ester carboxylesterase